CVRDRTSITSSQTPKPTSPTIEFAPTLCGKDGSDTTARSMPPCCKKLLNRLCFAFQSVRNPFLSAIPFPKTTCNVFPYSTPWLYPVPEWAIDYVTSNLRANLERILYSLADFNFLPSVEFPNRCKS